MNFTRFASFLCNKICGSDCTRKDKKSAVSHHAIIIIIRKKCSFTSNKAYQLQGGSNVTRIFCGAFNIKLIHMHKLKHPTKNHFWLIKLVIWTRIVCEARTSSLPTTSRIIMIFPSCYYWEGEGQCFFVVVYVFVFSKNCSRPKQTKKRFLMLIRIFSQKSFSTQKNKQKKYFLYIYIFSYFFSKIVLDKKMLTPLLLYISRF